MASGTNRRTSLIERASSISDKIYISDVRQQDCKDATLSIYILTSVEKLNNKVRQLFDIEKDDEFVVTTTKREQLTDDNLNLVEAGDTLYVLKDVTQELLTQTKEKVNYLPHYDTIVKGGMYEYYASEGQNPLPYAFAELIDNALAATAENVGPRTIEIRLHLDEDKVFVVDNGKGMTSRQLNNWAVYRLSKFIRQDKPNMNGEEDQGPQPLLNNAPRSLNSDISYFGVGGKQAIFFIGSSTTMITKESATPDVHELTLSCEQFQEKEQNKEEIYSGFILNRKPADCSHISVEDETMCSVVKEEEGQDSFTVVTIQGINPIHIPYLKNSVTDWTRQLAHIYHYYIHGPNGNVDKEQKNEDRNIFNNIDLVPDEWFSKIDIKVKLYTKANKEPVVYDLRDIDDDLQTSFIQSAASSFEFKATVEGTGVAEGVLRYHPFLYDRETYPIDHPHWGMNEAEDDQDFTGSDARPARGKRPIFECYWNGRLIPYTLVDDFDWCSVPKKLKSLPEECYNRVSGVIWTNDKFQVSTNKLTFIDLEVKLRDKQTVFARVTGKAMANTWERTEKRTDIGKEFSNWLKECHENLDKQIKFFGFQGKKTRPELPKNRQGPWGVFSKIEWDGKLYQTGTTVRIHRTLPILYGSIKQIWLFGDYEGDVYATGGELELCQEPKSLYDEVKFVPLNKLDRHASDKQINKYLADEEAKLPDKLDITWPSGDEIKQGEKRPAGKAIGDMKVEIANCKGEHINRLPGSHQRKLLIELKVIWHSPNGDQVLNHHICQHGKSWPFWFRKMENINSLGSYTLQLNVVLNESGTNTFSNIQLPSHKIKFTVTEAEAVKFAVGMLEGPFRIAVPFSLPLEFQDPFGNQTKPSSKLKPSLDSSELTLKHGEITTKGNNMIITDITATGDLGRNAYQGKSFSLVVKVPELAKVQSQTLKIRMLPGPPHSIHVSPDNLQIENGENVSLSVEVRDEASNITAYPRANATVKFAGAVGTPTYSVDCSRTGQGNLSGKPILLKKLKGEQTIQARVELNSYRTVPAVEIPVTVTPSSRASSITVSYGKDGETIVLDDGQDIIGAAGDPIKGIIFSIADEAGRPKEIDSNFASKIKVNWTPKLNVDSVLKNKLPDIKVPTNVTESKYCHITLLDGSGLDFSFTVKAVPGPPVSLKCQVQGSNKLRLGETLASDILVLVTDKHGNHIKKLEKSSLKDLEVTGPGLVESDIIRGFGQTSGFNLEKIRFMSGDLGNRELCVKWNDLKDFVRLEVTAGPADKLIISNWDLTQPLTVYNNGKTPQPLIAQLCDAFGNPTSEEGVKVQITRDVGIRLTPTPQPLKTDKRGQANFGYFVIYGKSGIYEIQPKAFIGRSIISGPKLRVAIQLDPTKPVRLELHDEDKLAKKIGALSVQAGELLQDLALRVVAEDDSVMLSAKPGCVRMKIMYPDNRPAYSIQPPDSKSKSDHTGLFHFSGRRAPEVAGMYAILFSYVDGVKYSLQTEQIPLEVCAGCAEKLVPIQDPGTPTVSNSKSAASRTLLRKLQLELQDKFGNPVNVLTASKPSVNVQITQNSSETNAEIPIFVGGTQKLSVPLAKGQAVIQNLVLEENSPGKDGQEYVLHCSLEGVTSLKTLPPYEISFLFYNDVKKQSQMAALTKERDNLMSVIRTYRSLFDTTQQLIEELNLSVREAQEEEQNLRQELRKAGIMANQIQSAELVDSLLESISKQREKLKTTPRRVCGLTPADKDPLILGKIAHLAEIEDDDVARVLSWHMSADMDCVITLTTQKAQEIHRKSDGRQQVLPLDSIYTKNLPDWKKPLPHGRFRPNWRPAGTPEYARNQLQFPSDGDKCKTVFAMLLGDTVMLDTLEDANKYRHEIVKFTHCPTILTRDGDRIRSNGKFGGLMNKALPVDKLRGAIFGAPLPKKYYDLCEQIDLLQSYKTAIQKRSSAEEDVKEQSKSQNIPEMKVKHKECQEAEAQLKALEARLGVSSPATSNSSTPLLEGAKGGSSAGKRRSLANKLPASPLATSTPHIVANKRPRYNRDEESNDVPDSTTGSLNDTPNGKTPSSTSKASRKRSNIEDVSTSQGSSPSTPPTRQSSRRAAAESSLAWESLRKKPRRT